MNVPQKIHRSSNGSNGIMSIEVSRYNEIKIEIESQRGKVIDPSSSIEQWTGQCDEYKNNFEREKLNSEFI